MRLMRITFVLAITAILVAGPYAYVMYRKSQCRNFRVVHEGVLYRSGQMSLPALKRAIFEYGIKTVITLRYADSPDHLPPDSAEEKFCKEDGINHFRIPYRPWWASDGTVPADKGVQTFLNVMKDSSNYPVLIHCFAGIHRTGSYCAVFRMEFDQWSNSEAVQEMRNLGYTDEHLDVLSYLENYRRAGTPGRNDMYQGPATSIRPASHHTERKVMSDER